MSFSRVELLLLFLLLTLDPDQERDLSGFRRSGFGFRAIFPGRRRSRLGRRGGLARSGLGLRGSLESVFTGTPSLGRSAGRRSEATRHWG